MLSKANDNTQHSFNSACNCTSLRKKKQSEWSRLCIICTKELAKNIKTINQVKHYSIFWRNWNKQTNIEKSSRSKNLFLLSCSKLILQQDGSLKFFSTIKMIFQSFCNECINECVFETHSNLLMAFQKLKRSVLNSKDLLMTYISTVVKDVFNCEEVNDYLYCTF